MAGGKYSEELQKMKSCKGLSMHGMISPVVRAAWADNNIFVQLKKFTDTKRDGDIQTKDNKKTKVKGKEDAALVHDTLMKVKSTNKG